MGSRSKTLIDQGNNVIFAFEEAIGFMFGSNVLDKDGVSAAAVMAELIVELNSRGMTLGDQLEAIYAEYGFHMTNNSSASYLLQAPFTPSRNGNPTI